MPQSENYLKMIWDVSKSLAEDLEDDAVHRSFTATTIDTSKWAEKIQNEVESLMRDILMEETQAATRLQEKRMSTAKEFALNHISNEIHGPAFNSHRFAIDTLVACFFNKPRPKKENYES